MLTIHLHNLRFTGFHGVYEEERILGNEYEVNIEAELAAKENITRLDETVDYVELYEIVKNRMAKPSPLLETIAQDLVELFRQYSDDIRSVKISIKKLYPPIENFIGSVGISYSRDFRA